MAELWSAHADLEILAEIHASIPSNSMAPCKDGTQPENQGNNIVEKKKIRGNC
jgi:hypothetical protein